MSEAKHPLQPIVNVNDILRFKENKIVSHLLDSYPGGLNSIAGRPDFSKEDYVQLMQLIGYGVSGFYSLSCCDDAMYRKVQAHVKKFQDPKSKVDPRDLYITELENQLKTLKDAIREPIADLFGIHPENLQ